MIKGTIEEAVEETYKELFVRYEKALDKACEHLVSNNICCLDICPFKGKENCIDFCTNKDMWKEWLLKDE